MLFRHNLFSFQLGFLVLCFVWGIVRAVFWWLTPVLPEPSVAAIGMLWYEYMVLFLFSSSFRIPINLQFATFSLLVLFYAHLVHRATWEKTMKRICTATYIGTNVVFLILQAGIVDSNHLFLISLSLIDTFIIVCVGLYAYYTATPIDDGDWLLPAQVFRFPLI